MDAMLVLANLLAAGPAQHGRLLRLHTPLGPDVLVAETLLGHERVDGCGFCISVTALAIDAGLDLEALQGKPVLLQLLADDGGLRPLHGLVSAAELVGSNGGLARYRLRIEPWLALLRQRLDSYVFHDMSVVEILDSVFSDYQDGGALQPAWRWQLQEQGRYARRSITSQYEETDFDFVTRLLAEEGIFYWVEHEGDPASESLGRHVLVLADAPEYRDLGTVRFHRKDATEAGDSIQQWNERRRARTAVLRRASWDYRTLQTRPAEAGGEGFGSVRAVDDDIAGPYAWHDQEEGQWRVRRQQEALQAEARQCAGEGSWRRLAPGAAFLLAQHPAYGGEAARFACLQVTHWARNNLGAEIIERAEALLGTWRGEAATLPPLLSGLGTDPDGLGTQDAWPGASSQHGDNLQLGEGFYRNRFTAIPADVPYRPRLCDGEGLRRHPRPRVHGTQTAIVVGDGGPVHTDRDHRVRIQFHWQRGADAVSGQAHPAGEDNAPGTAAAWSWARVATPWAGDNWGGVFVPRVGQEVLVAFLEGDIDRPVIIGAVYNGQGNRDAPYNAIAGGGAGATGNAPAWFDGNGHAAVFVGLKSQALSASQDGSGGYQQLRLDDSNGQGRIQLSTTQHAATLTLGHLKAGQDNVRGVERGFGMELSTVASGAIRAGAGLLLATESGGRQLDAPRLAAQLQESAQLLQTLDETARNQQAGLEDEPEQLPARQSLEDLRESLAATGDGAAPGDGVGGGEGTVPAWSAPVIAGCGEQGFVALTPADQAWVSGTQSVFSAGHDINWLSQGNLVQLVAGGVVLFTHGGEAPKAKPHREIGIALHAAAGKVSARAHKDLARVAAKDSVLVTSTQADIDVDAKKHLLVAAAGAYLKLEGGDIELGAPGTIEFKAGKREFVGPKSVMLELPNLPVASLAPRQIEFDITLQDMPGPKGYPLANTPWKIVRSIEEPYGMDLIAEDRVILQGKSDQQGRLAMAGPDQELLAREYCKSPGNIWLLYPGQSVRLSVVEERDGWTEEDKAVTALSAAGFSPDVRTYLWNAWEVGELEYAMNSLGETSRDGIAGKLDS